MEIRIIFADNNTDNQTEHSKDNFVLLFFSSSSEKKEKRGRKKSRIEPFIPLLPEI